MVVLADEEIYLSLQFNYDSQFTPLGEKHLFAFVLQKVQAVQEAYYQAETSGDPATVRAAWDAYQRAVIEAVREYRATHPMTEEWRAGYERWAFGVPGEVDCGRG